MVEITFAGYEAEGDETIAHSCGLVKLSRKSKSTKCEVQTCFALRTSAECNGVGRHVPVLPILLPFNTLTQERVQWLF